MGTSTNSGYQTHYHWSNPPGDVQPGILNPDSATNPENNPIFGVDPSLLTERATHFNIRIYKQTTNHIHGQQRR